MLIFLCRSDVPSTRAQALDQIIILSVHNDAIRRVLGAVTTRTVYSLRNSPEIWYNMHQSLQVRVRRALIALEDNKLNTIIKSYCCEKCENSARLRNELKPYLLCVSFSCLVTY